MEAITEVIKDANFYHHRFTQLLTVEALSSNATAEKKAEIEKIKKANDSSFVQELESFLLTRLDDYLFSNPKVKKFTKQEVIAAIRSLTIRTSDEIEALLNRSAEFSNAKKLTVYYLNRFSCLLANHNDSLFVQELDGFLYRDQGISKFMKTQVIAAIHTISARTRSEIENLLKRSPQFADGFAT